MSTAPALVTSRKSLQVNDLRRTQTIVLVSIAIVSTILLCSPNYQFSSLDRLTPLGSDFLQEWTGGYIWSSPQRAELYNAEHFKRIQHDFAIVGFHWPESNYYPMVYPPFYYMVLSPLTMVPYWIAALIWAALLAVATAATVWMWTSYYPDANEHWGKCLLATVAFFPFLMSINTSHKSIFVLMILVATYLLLFRKKPMHAGFVFGLIAFKPHLGILIGIVMLLKRQWLFVVGCGSTVLVLIGLSFVAGGDLCQDYFWQCLGMGDYSSNGGYLLAESHNVLGAISLTLGTGTLSSNLISLVLAALLLLAIATAFRGKLDTTSEKFGIQFSLLVLGTILLSPHFYIYDLTIVLLPLALIAFQVRSSKYISGYRRTLVWLSVALFVIAGIATKVAENFGFQPTLVIMLLMVCVLTQACLQGQAKQSVSQVAL